MTAKASVPNTFQAQAGPIPLSQLDANFSALVGDLNENNTLANYYVDAGSADAIAISTASGQTFTAGIAGAWLDVKIAANNTGGTPCTLAINGGATSPVVDCLGNALLQDALLVGCVYRLVFDGTSWRVANMVTGSGSSTLVGSLSDFSGTTNFVLVWQVTRFQVTAGLQGNVTGTSISNQFNLGSVPSWLRPPATTQFAPLSYVYDNGIDLFTGVGVEITNASSTWSVFVNLNTSGFTSSGLKGFNENAYQMFSYLLI